MTTGSTTEHVKYEEFREEWIAEIEEADPSPLEKGRRFAAKLITQWLGVTTDDENFLVCDGSGDGGIDVAYLHQPDTDPGNVDDSSVEGHTWYLVQSKYGTAFTGSELILAEGSKVIATLTGQNTQLADDTRQLLDKITSFRQQASDADRIVLVFATTDPISEEDREALYNIKIIGRERVSANFDVEEVSLHTIWETLIDVEPTPLSVRIRMQFVEQTSGLLVGTVSLLDMFDFMQSYQYRTGDFNQLYEKNVRQFLGNRRKINRGIAETLRERPDKFGLYNNGITIVVSGYSRTPDGDVITVHDPYVVNGCQTTKTIWEVLDSKINSGGTGDKAAFDSWREQASRGGVVTKIVSSDESEIVNITKFTNSQNGVRDQDFIALNRSFQSWKPEMENEYGVFLEIQRGAADAQRAWQKHNPLRQPRFNAFANAFDLVKVYGAGWLAVPGIAFGKNAPFLPPKGSVYERIFSRQGSVPEFGARDLYAAFRVKATADRIGFGRNAAQPSRRLSRFLYYYVMIRMLNEVVRLTPNFGGSEINESVLTDAVIKLTNNAKSEPWDQLSGAAIRVIDRYLTPGGNNSVYSEEKFIGRHDSNINAFLKAEELGDEEFSPLLVRELDIQNAAFALEDRLEQVEQVLLSE